MHTSHVGVFFSAAMLLCQQSPELRKAPTTGELRQSIGASRLALDQLNAFIRGATTTSLTGSEFNKQLITGWTVYITHVMNTVIQSKMAEAKLSNQV